MNSHDQALYELMSERYDGLQANCDTLRASLGRVERRNEELDLALEVARRERVEAILRNAEHIRNITEKAEAELGAARRERDEAKAWKVEYMRQVAEKDEQVAEVHLLLFKAEADREAALAQAAGLREALKLLLGSCVYDDGELTVPSRYVVHGATAALDTPGPTMESR